MSDQSFTEQDLNKVFTVRVYPNDRDNVEYGTGAAGGWLFDHREQKVTCIEIGELGWCARVQARDKTTGWAFRTDLLNVNQQVFQPQLL